MTTASPILLVEDTPSLSRVYMQYLAKAGYDATCVETGKAALEAIRVAPPGLILLDLQLPDMNGMEILRTIQDEQLPIAVVVITAHGSVKVAVEAMQLGAYDFLMKPFNADRLLVTIKNTFDRVRLEKIVEVYQEDIARDHYYGFIGKSLKMQAVYRIIDSAASSKATVFITGESGTGKEVTAQAIHNASPRAKGPFVAINCAAIPKDLMESEIFGHVKGAFTGAVTDREGAAKDADGGTLFLDEICEMDLSLQTKLLRFLQTGTVQKVGSTKAEKVDIRIVCATNRDPMVEVEEGRFREDLFYRLHVIPVHLPPLREREDDVLAIAQQFLAEYAAEEGKSFTHYAAEVEDVLARYQWPGNVRQLQNVLRNVVVLHEGEAVTLDMLPPPLDRGEGPGFAPRGPMVAHPFGADAPVPAGNGSAIDPALPEPIVVAPKPRTPADIRPLWLVEKDTIEQAIEVCDGNIPKAAAMLEISASTIYRKKQVWEKAETS